MMQKINWDLVVEDLGPRLYRYFRVRFNDSLADELTQESLLRLVDKYQKKIFKPSKGSLQAYAFGIANFVRLEAIRNETKHLHEDIENIYEQSASSSASVEDELEVHGEHKLLRSAIKNLPEPQQEILLLTIDSEFSIKDISKILTLPQGTIKSHIHRAKKTLTLNLQQQATK